MGGGLWCVCVDEIQNKAKLSFRWASGCWAELGNKMRFYFSVEDKHARGSMGVDKGPIRFCPFGISIQRRAFGIG